MDADLAGLASVDPDTFAMCGHLLAAWGVGALIGLERSYHGRPAGFRTHALVCVASALLMLVTVYQGRWLGGQHADAFRTDPTRMAQGIMTGIGFLGAGVIFKEGLTVRGLTTAASIWVTAALGILFGIGLFMPALLVSAMTLGTLSAFRWLESHLPTYTYAHLHLRFRSEDVIAEDELRRLLVEQGFVVSQVSSYRLTDAGARFEYRLVIRTLRPANLGRLGAILRGDPRIPEFRLSPTGD